MAVSQTILCTTVPNGFDVDNNVFQVSLVFSPRLRSDARHDPGRLRRLARLAGHRRGDDVRRRVPGPRR